MSQRLDLIIFGATGFTGKYVVRSLSQLTKSGDRPLTWGIAGRSKEKLQELLTLCGKQLGYSLDSIPIIIADVKDEKSLNEMARYARIIVNCCGPYSFFGEPVIKACIKEGTHQVDVSAEVTYMEEIQLKYHKEAEEKGLYIISACGYACIPVDLGIVFMEKKFGGTLNSVEAYGDYWEEGESAAGSAFNYSTWESMISVFGNGEKLKQIRKQLFPHPLPQFEPKLKLKMIPHKSEVVNSWVFPLDALDRPAVQRSQRYFYEKHSKRPIQIETYFCVKSFFLVLLINFLALITLVLSSFSIGRKILLRYPKTFSGGMINRETPSEERIEKVRFSMTLYGEGWIEKLPDANHEYSTPPNKAIVAKISGCNPGYGASAIMLVLSAITVITESDKMPKNGGVYSPGYAFANTSLAEQLNKNGVLFEILHQKDLNKNK